MRENTNTFIVKKHNSGEYEITLAERIRGNSIMITWNYFEDKDIMIPMLKAAAVRHTYGDKITIFLDAPYLPYARQDRVFQAGQSIAYYDLINIISTQFTRIVTMALHCADGSSPISYYINKLQTLESIKYNAMALQSEYNIVFPDESACNHYYYPDDKMITFIKYRDEKTGDPTLKMDLAKVPKAVNFTKTYLICDDIGDGNRTFVNCATALRAVSPIDIKIELMLYHSFCTYGLQNLFDIGISKMKIINPDSYNYLINKFPENKEFFELVTFKGR